MSAPVVVRGNHSHLFGPSMLPVLEELFMSSYEQHPSRREVLFQTKQTDRDIWQYSSIEDMDLFVQMSEGQEYDYKRPKQGASKTLSILKYGLGASISQETIDDGKFDLAADIVRKMGRSARETKEISAMNVFNNGFSSETTADGLSLFNAAHTMPSGGTFRNVLATDADLSPSSLDQALADFETQFVGDSGIIELIRPEILLVSPNQKRYAKELVGSDLKPDSAENNMNSLKGEGLMVVASPHLTDPDAWFLLSSKANHGLRIINRADVQTKSEVDFDRDAIKYKSMYREIIGAVHGKGVFGSDGV